MREPGAAPLLARRPAGSTEEVAAKLPDEVVTRHLLSTELGHDLAHTLTFLRYLTGSLDDGLAAGQSLEEVRGFALREIERMEKVLGHLRKLKLPTPGLLPGDLHAIIERSIEQLGELSGAMTVEVCIEPTASVRTDEGFLGAALHHLLRHAAANASAERRITLHASPLSVGSDARVRMDILDEGPPLSVSDPAALFDAWGFASEIGRASCRERVSSPV